MSKASMAFLVSLLAGCGLMPLDQAPADTYATVAPQSAGQQVAGIWTAQHSSAAISLRVDEDGRGVVCRGDGASPELVRLKYANNTFYLSDGRTIGLREAGGQLVASFSTEADRPIHFSRDAGLVAANPYCRQRLQQAYL